MTDLPDGLMILCQKKALNMAKENICKEISGRLILMWHLRSRLIRNMQTVD